MRMFDIFLIMCYSCFGYQYSDFTSVTPPYFKINIFQLGLYKIAYFCNIALNEGGSQCQN